VLFLIEQTLILSFACAFPWALSSSDFIGIAVLEGMKWTSLGGQREGGGMWSTQSSSLVLRTPCSPSRTWDGNFALRMSFFY